MSNLRLRGRALMEGVIYDDVSIATEESFISEVVIHSPDPAAPHEEVLIVPGFVDLHIHGGAGADFMDATPEAIRKVLRFHARNGTTTLAATTLSASPEALVRAVREIESEGSAPVADGAEIGALHLEGPYISALKCGAQDPDAIRPADVHELEHLMALAPSFRWIVTIAPEVKGAKAMIERFHQEVLFSIGHTAADYGTTLDAIQHGARSFTHLFNAMTGLGHREPGAVGAALISAETSVELIADGFHVHPAILQLAARMMPERIVLVTDAMRAAGMPDGRYSLQHHDVFVSEGAARLEDGTLAGSTLTMARAVQNMVELAGLPIELVLPLATEIPARVLGMADRKGRLDIGYDADLVVLSPRLEVLRVIVRGMELTAA